MIAAALASILQRVADRVPSRCLKERWKVVADKRLCGDGNRCRSKRHTANAIRWQRQRYTFRAMQHVHSSADVLSSAARTPRSSKGAVCIRRWWWNSKMTALVKIEPPRREAGGRRDECRRYQYWNAAGYEFHDPSINLLILRMPRVTNATARQRR